MASGYGLAGGTYYQFPRKLERVFWRRQWHERNGNGTTNGDCGTNATQRDTTPAANKEQKGDSAVSLSLYGGLYCSLVVSCKHNTRSSAQDPHHHETEPTRTINHILPTDNPRTATSHIRHATAVPLYLTRETHPNHTYQTILTHQPSRPIPLLPLLARSPRMLRHQHICRR
jgi:hypothetical protein